MRENVANLQEEKRFHSDFDVREEFDNCFSLEIGFFRGRGYDGERGTGLGGKCFENMSSQRIQLTPEQLRGWGADPPDSWKSTYNLWSVLCIHGSVVPHPWIQSASDQIVL